MQTIETPLLAESTASRESTGRAAALVRLLLVVALVGIAHGYSVYGGLWLDDHLHWQHMREAGWTYSGLVDASTLDAVGTRIWLWGDEDRALRFFRPVAFAVMKAEYTLVDWQPGPMHVFNLLWHVAVAMLVGSLAMRVVSDRSAGFVASLLYAVFPGHVVSVYWIACQTEILVTLLSLIAALSYARWSGWWTAGEGAPPRRSFGWLAMAMLAYVAAMGCRENAIVLPAILAVGDLLSHGRRVIRGRLAVWAVLGVLAILYLVLRSHALKGMAWPHRPYLVWPTDPEFPLFAFRKVLYYLSGLFLYLPVLPGSAMEYFAERTSLLIVGLGVTAIVILAAVGTTRRRLVLLGLAWMFLVFAPILPVEPAPHHLYLPGVGSAVLWSAALVGVWRWLTRRWSLARRGEPHAGRVALGTLVFFSLVGCGAFAWLYSFGTGAENQVVADVLERGDPLAPGDELFFINLPMIASWVTPAIETARPDQLRNLRAYVLTLSDEIIMQLGPGRVIPVDRHTLRLESEPPGWLAGAAGPVFADLCGIDWPLQEGQRIPGPAYDVVVEKIDAEGGGATSLRFEFHEPIDKPGRHFFLGSQYQMAYPLHFVWEPTPAVTGPPPRKD